MNVILTINDSNGFGEVVFQGTLEDAFEIYLQSELALWIESQFAWAKLPGGLTTVAEFAGFAKNPEDFAD
jgi:hypothetical protein